MQCLCGNLYVLLLCLPRFSASSLHVVKFENDGVRFWQLVVRDAKEGFIHRRTEGHIVTATHHCHQHIVLADRFNISSVG